MIAQLAKGGVSVGASRELEEARDRFARDRCVLLRQFVAPGLLAWLQAQVTNAPFQTLVHHLMEGDDVTELVAASDALDSRLLFLFNDRRLFDAIEFITGCDPIGCFLGRVYKMVPGMGHRDDWHHDVDGSRMAALSVNLTEQRYEGGVLQIMDWEEQRLLHEVANTGPGDAILFHLSMQLRHKLTEVVGSVPKVAYAGWFEKQPVYGERLRRGAASPSGRAEPLE